MIRSRKHRQFKRAASALLCFLLAAFALPAAVCAENESKTVRVGWYDSAYNTMDENGRRYGYVYDYQQKIAAYTGWTYEYVEGSWPDLLRMLEDGEIDLMSDVSYMPSREDHMLYSSVPMGVEEYYVFVLPGNERISPADPYTLQGTRVGVNKSSIQAEFFDKWKQRTGIRTETVLLSCSENESLEMLETGELDAYVTVDAFVNPKTVPVCKVGASDFFFVVSTRRPDLLEELDSALNQIVDENRYYNQQLFDKYIRRAGANSFLSASEKEWLSAHGPIRVGYQDNYLAFCALDKETGELTGVMKDYLENAADCMANAHLDFEAIAYPTAASALEALQNGEVDCVFPANFTAYDGEELGIVMTPLLTDTEVLAVVPRAKASGFFTESTKGVKVAVNEGNPNYDRFLAVNFPQWTPVRYPTTTDCIYAVAGGKADCVLLGNYRYNNISRLCEKKDLTTVSTGVVLDYCFAVEKGHVELYSILTKVVGQVPKSSVNTALSRYISEESKISARDFLEDHLPHVLMILGVTVLVISALLVQNMRAVEKARSLIAATETDELTGLYNRNYFFQYANRMYREQPNSPMDAIVLNIEQFHSVNALNGRDFGDRCLRTLGAESGKIAKERGGIAGRFGADRFDIYCRHTEDYKEIFDRLQSKLDTLSPNAAISLRMGVMPWMPDTEPEQLFDHARTACSMARGRYNERLIVFDDKVREREGFEQRLQHDLRHSVENGEFEVYYQPMFDIRVEPPKLCCAEALVRWHHPEFGLVQPSEFIPLFEKNGQITALDRYVWKVAVGQIARWRDRYGTLLPVSINLSRVDVIDPAIKQTLETLLEGNGLEQSAVKLEVTESAYIENAAHVIPVIERLRERGYEVEMDDFGSGYSSLNMLSSTPIDYLKMDRAFVQNIEKGEKDILFIEMILGIARNLNVSVVAEGVETEAQFEILKKHGCDLAQGYYFSRPLPAREFEDRFFRQAE